MSHLPIRILIVEDHLIARVGLTAIVETQSDMEVAGDARSGEEALSIYARVQPDVTLMDLRLPGMSGVDTMVAVRRLAPQARFIALSSYSGDEDIKRALNAGAQAYLTKEVLDTELVSTIRLVAAGETYLSATVAAVLAARGPRPDLTAREVEVLALIVRGFGNKHIAYELGIAEYTVKNHVKSILGKLGAGDRTQAATAALRRGIIQ
jgi:DNA-binding NarL/FixJ family response regulator